MGLFSSIGSIIGGPAGGIIGGIGDSLIGGSISGSGADKAGKTYNSYLQMALDALKQGSEETQARVKPTAQIGTNAITSLSDILLNGDMSKFYDNPAYTYGRDEALRGVQANAAAKGVLMSGNTLKELQKNASGLASQNYQSYINNLDQLFGRADPYLSTYNNIPYMQAQDAANILIGQGANARDTQMAKTASKSSTWDSLGQLGSLFSSFGGF